MLTRIEGLAHYKTGSTWTTVCASEWSPDLVKRERTCYGPGQKVDARVKCGSFMLLLIRIRGAKVHGESKQAGPHLLALPGHRAAFLSCGVVCCVDKVEC